MLSFSWLSKERKRSPGTNYADDMKTNIRVIFICTASNFELNNWKKVRIFKILNTTQISSHPYSLINTTDSHCGMVILTVNSTGGTSSLTWTRLIPETNL